MADELILLDGYYSMFATRVRVALAIKGIEYESRPQNLLTGVNELLLEMNPVHKKIPVLIHNGKPICESMIIVEYIDEVWKDKPPLLPSDPYQRAQARFWVDFVDQKISLSSRRIPFLKGEEQQVCKKEFIDALKLMEQELGAKTYFGGDNFGFVDIALITFYACFYTYEIFGNFSIEEHCPKLMAWGKRCMEIDKVSDSLPLPHKVYEMFSSLDLEMIYQRFYLQSR